MKRRETKQRKFWNTLSLQKKVEAIREYFPEKKMPITITQEIINTVYDKLCN